MGDLSTLEVIIIAIVEGLTEFLPVYGTHDYYTKSVGHREYGICESFYGNHTVRCNPFGGSSWLLETFLPSEPYSGSGRYFRAETLPA